MEGTYDFAVKEGTLYRLPALPISMLRYVLENNDEVKFFPHVTGG